MPITAQVRQELNKKVSDGVSVYEMAAESGVDRATIGRFQAGKSKLSGGTLDRLCRYLRLTLTEGDDAGDEADSERDLFDGLEEE